MLANAVAVDCIDPGVPEKTIVAPPAGEMSAAPRRTRRGSKIGPGMVRQDNGKLGRGCLGTGKRGLRVQVPCFSGSLPRCRGARCRGARCRGAGELFLQHYGKGSPE